MKGQRGVCTVEGCGRPHKARGYCQVHYQHWMRGVPITAEVRTRDRTPFACCTVEGCEDPVKAKGFCQMHYARLLRHGHISHSGRTKPTKICTAEGCDNHLYAKGLCHQHYIQKRNLRDKFGLTPGDFNKMSADQAGGCAICQRTDTRKNWRSGKRDALVVDHDHGTGKVRGLLCDNCNRAIGLLGDDPAVLRAAAAYLDLHAPKPAGEPRTLAADGSERDYLELVPVSRLTGDYPWPPGFVN